MKIIEKNIEFYFRNKLWVCKIFIDSSEFPCLVFVDLRDAALIHEFGDEISLMTDCEKLLPQKNDYHKLVVLKQSILNELTRQSVFSNVKEKIKSMSNI